MGHLPKQHITHVFIDECGQAVEPEAVSAVAGLLGSRVASLPADSGVTVNGTDNDQGDSNCKGLLVLGGDPLQLGPVCPGGEIGLGDYSFKCYCNQQFVRKTMVYF
ncbi:hypothetical protein J437_LFUL006746 [Ladona fulva]|uniref:RNA helicase n=1 Tax=Ladona fulva TaxID=123851 RepID=A0A8K0NXX9_LADFU|nr:hypothetical protein J437_LFUL006746 [Ladona fulva]